MGFLGCSSLDDFISKTVPYNLLLDEFKEKESLSQDQATQKLKDISTKNKIYKNWIGQGYSNCLIPKVLLRHIYENPGWYTPYTPYQPEIAQGRLEALFNYQTMVCDLTGLEVANASLLDEGTSAAEAMIMMYNNRNKITCKEGIEKLEACYDFLNNK